MFCLFILFYVSVRSHEFTCTVSMLEPQRPEDSIGFLGAGVVKEGCEPPCGRWGLNPALLQG